MSRGVSRAAREVGVRCEVGGVEPGAGIETGVVRRRVFCHAALVGRWAKSALGSFLSNFVCQQQSR